MAMRGRKRKLTAKRRQTTREGRGQGRDPGTPELQFHKARALGAAPVKGKGLVRTDGKPVRIERTGCAIHLMQEVGLIDQDTANAAEWYQLTWWYAYGRPFPKTADFNHVRGSDRDIGKREAIAACSFVDRLLRTRLSRRETVLVKKIILEDVMPHQKHEGAAVDAMAALVDIRDQWHPRRTDEEYNVHMVAERG